MQSEPQSSFLVRLLCVAFFFILTIAALAWFVISTADFITQIRLNAAVIAFDKGAVYMLGIGLGLLLLTAGGVVQGLLGKSLPSKYESLLGKGFVISILLLFLLPHAVHYGVSQYTQKQHYTLCNEATYRWFLYSKFYFTNNASGCDALIREKQNPNFIRH